MSLQIVDGNSAAVYVHIGFTSWKKKTASLSIFTQIGQLLAKCISQNVRNCKRRKKCLMVQFHMNGIPFCTIVDKIC